MSGINISPTEKTQEALSSAKDLCLQCGNNQVTPLHLMSVLVANDEDLGSRICRKAGLDNLEGLRASLEKEIQRLPRQTPPPTSVYFDSSLERVLTNAAQAAKKTGDSYLALDPIIAQLVDQPSVASALRQSGLNGDRVKKAIETLRGSKKVESARAEQTYEALAKYGNDLVTQVSTILTRYTYDR